MKMKFIPAALLAAAAGVVQADETSGFNLKAGSGITFKSADGTASFRVGGAPAVGLRFDRFRHQR